MILFLLNDESRIASIQARHLIEQYGSLNKSDYSLNMIIALVSDDLYNNYSDTFDLYNNYSDTMYM